MDEPVETELKLEFDPADRDRLAACAPLTGDGRSTRTLAATYFDTPAFVLDKAGYSLRIRRDGSQRVQTVKAASDQAAGLFVRGEWEKPISSDKPQFDERSGPLAQLFDAATLAEVSPIFSTAIERMSGVIERPDGAHIEYAIDTGEVRAGARSSAVCEIELELSQGTSTALFDLARILNEQVPLRLGVLTKSERGYALVRGASTLAAKAEPIRLDPAMTAADAFAVIAASCIRQYRRNEDLLLLSGGSEPVHQARVAIRRLRSAFWLFKPLFDDDPQAAMFAAELRWLAGELGEVRDIDVLLPRVDSDARPPLVAIRETRFGHVRDLLGSERARMLPIELAAWLTAGHWRAGTEESAASDANITSYANSRLERLRKRIKREGKGLAAIDDDHRHEVRKDAKKLRYATEFFVSLYPGRKPRRRMDRFLDRLEDLQDKLGKLNDLAAAPDLIARLGIDLSTPKLGKKERKRLLEDAEACFDALVDSKRFWRD